MAVNYAPSKLELGEVEYPASDGELMAETGFHVTLIAYILSMLRAFFRERQDVYVGSDMFIYYEEGDPQRRVAPDTFVIFGVPNHERRSWFTWKEGKGPDVVFEFTSKGTQEEDRWRKKGLYEWLGVKEYFLFDPLDEYLSPRLQGFRLIDGAYTPILLVNGQLRSEVLGLTLGGEGHMLTLTGTKTGERLLPPPELLNAYRTLEARAEEEADARRAAEAEVARLRAELERLKGKSD
jgi:Uma2 family endonuclease